MARDPENHFKISESAPLNERKAFLVRGTSPTVALLLLVLLGSESNFQNFDCEALQPGGPPYSDDYQTICQTSKAPPFRTLHQAVSSEFIRREKTPTQRQCKAKSDSDRSVGSSVIKKRDEKRKILANRVLIFERQSTSSFTAPLLFLYQGRPNICWGYPSHDHPPFWGHCQKVSTSHGRVEREGGG